MFNRLAMLILLALWLVATRANASFHLWQINEIYSNADGSVQFIELTALAAGQQFLAGHRITSLSGSQTRSYTFPNNLPGDTAETEGGGDIYGGSYTSYKSFLIGTQGFAALNIVAPDYVVPNGFLFLSNGTINFADADVVSYAALPTTGAQSINRAGFSAAATPKNFAGMTGSLAAAALPNYSDLWWLGTSEDGWGVTIQQHGAIQFVILFVYDQQGKPTWYVMPGGNWNAANTAYTGALYKPTSAPLSNYTPASFLAGASVGTLTITYTGNAAARLQYTINGTSATKTIVRQQFGPTDNTPGLQVGDMWWGGTAQDGWGLSITQQFRTLFGAWYTYDQTGNVIWYTMPGGTWNGNTYSGDLYTANSSAWLGVPYDASRFTALKMGSISIAFSSANAATMTYSFTAGPFAGITQSKPIVRQPY